MNFYASINFSTLTFTRASFFIAFLISLTSPNTAFAVNFTTTANGNWSQGAVWKKGTAAPTDLHNGDTVVINHRVSSGNLKITNGGTLVINSELKSSNITISGSRAKIIVEQGATLEAISIQGATSSNVIYKDANPLPVTLVFFGLKKADQNQESNTLTWNTASELNNDYFSIEKSTDGIAFKEAGRVKGTNLVSGAAYSFEDKNAATRTYYRLKQVDFDGTITYSAIIVATRNQKLAVNGREIVFSQTYNGTLRLFNQAGQAVKVVQLNQAITYNLPENLQGLFILQLESADFPVSQRIML